MAKSVLLAILSIASLCYCINANLIQQICSKSTNPSLCTKSLRSDPRSRSADLRGLGHITINKARAASQVTQRVAISLSTGGTKARADACVEYCTDAIELLNDCSALLRDRSGRTIDDVKTKGSAALTDISTCDDEFGPEEPKKLRNASRTTQDLMDIFLVIANLL
ncbi:pectinesterase inhibitor-like [Primulina tabacum]|uniref:pectinesterase inhibitor-like n=1 Tax=Primulina tabacum TaxID=48773 RepID=UPI003F594D1E